jgi:Holliday junction resolvase RusA-like endonuclease
MVKEKANKRALKMEIEFQCLNGWLQRVKQRRNITWKAISGESSAVDVEASDKWRKNVAPIIKQYAPQDIFNMDKTAVL